MMTTQPEKINMQTHTFSLWTTLSYIDVLLVTRSLILHATRLYVTFLRSSMEKPPGPRLMRRSRPPTIERVWKKS